MHLSTVVMLCACALAAAADSPAQYSSKYENFDVDTILTSDRILKNYLKCFMDQGPCTAEGKDFRRILPEALETSCGKCTDNMKKNIRKVARHLMDKRPADWEKLVDKYDKDRKFKDSFDQFLAEA